jgi:hypothetical protein
MENSTIAENRSAASNLNPLDLVEGNFVASAIIELRCARYATFRTVCKVSLRATTGIAFVPVILSNELSGKQEEGLQGWPLHVWRQ